MVSESTTKTVLSSLQPNTRYAVTVVPVYAEGDGPRLSDFGKTSEYWWGGGWKGSVSTSCRLLAQSRGGL